jgi:hypothetical protein
MQEATETTVGTYEPPSIEARTVIGGQLVSLSSALT